VFHGTTSLRALQELGGADAVLIDGDHNWYTVFNELKLIERWRRDLSQPFPLVLLHDIGWPYGRRDLYYDPQSIPDAFRKPYARKGMRPGVSALVESGGLNAHLCHALEEAGPRNGVLTAIEDFLQEARPPIELVKVSAFHGLGILLGDDRKVARAELAQWLAGLEPAPAAAPYVAALEASRVDLEILEVGRAVSEDRAPEFERAALAERVAAAEQETRAARVALREQAAAVRALQQKAHARESELAALEQRATESATLLGESRRDLHAVRTERDRHRRHVEDLGRLVDHLEVAIGNLLHTRRWHVGNALGNLGRRLLTRPPTDPSAHALKIVARLRAWQREGAGTSGSGTSVPGDAETGHPELPPLFDPADAARNAGRVGVSARPMAGALIDAVTQSLRGAESRMAERSDALHALQTQLSRLSDHLQRQHDDMWAVQSSLGESTARTDDGLVDLLLRFCDQFLHEEHAIRLTLTDVRSVLAAAAGPVAAAPPPAVAPASAPIERPLDSHRARSPRPRTRLSVSVCAWDVASNPLGRAHLIADMLSQAFTVQVLGACFPAYGASVWGPHRHSRVPIKTWLGRHFPHHFQDMRKVADNVKSDAVIVSKPRLPSYELGMLIGAAMERPLLLDVDDYELSFFPDRTALSLDEVSRHRADPDYLCPYGNLWTRYCESIVGAATALTVSNAILQDRYGGTVLPHARDEQVFDPARYDRQAVRAQFGYGPAHFVILFVGTPRLHKGLPEIATALHRLGNPRYRLCVVGSIADRVQRSLAGVAPDYVDFHPEQPFDALPATLCMADLLCLLQDPTSEISHYQMPAKFTDGLAMGIPMLASDVPPLRLMAGRGLVELVGPVGLEDKIQDLFTHYDDFKTRASANRQVFLQEYSYAAHTPALCRAVEELANARSDPARAYQDLLELHRVSFGGGTSRRGHA
jgi:glycosyltransferase involved in cell wall biosynthesis